MTQIDDAPALARGASFDSLKATILGWLEELDGLAGAAEPRLGPLRPLPTIDEFGLLRCEGRWVSLTPTEERVMRELLDHVGRVCSRAQLVKAGWPLGLANERMLDTYVRRLRAKIPEYGLEIRTVRKRGFVLELELDGTAG
jgi:hypothetical protein